MKTILTALAAIHGLLAVASNAGEGEDNLAISRLKTIGALYGKFVTAQKRLPRNLDELSASQEVPDSSLFLSPTAKDQSQPGYVLFHSGTKYNNLISPAETVVMIGRFTLGDGRIPIVYASGSVRLIEPAR